MFVLSLLLGCPPPIITAQDSEPVDSQDTQDSDSGFNQDADMDGYDKDVDCDDEDPRVHPGAQEIWYNGIDEDCDGNDCDQDGDGQDATLCAQPGPDCDDKDATVNTGAVESWYDGIDQDCSGGCDYDADHDGWARADAVGDECRIGDCEDTIAEISPDGVEVVDGLDGDCDGNLDNLFGLDFVVQVKGRGGEFGAYLASSDSDGDAFPELWVSAPGYPEGSSIQGYAGRFDGTEVHGSQDTTVDFFKAESTVAASTGMDGLGAPMVVLDPLGDGAQSLLLGDALSGSVYVFAEPGPGSHSPSEAELIFTSSAYQVGAGPIALVQADARPYFVIGSPFEITGAGQGHVFLLDATVERSGSVQVQTSGYKLYVNGSTSEELGASVAVLDMDGDGRDDLAVGAPGLNSSAGIPDVGGVYALSDAVLADIHQGSLGQFVNVASMPQAKGDVAGGRFGQAMMRLPDTNGDGRDELVVVSENSSGVRLHILYGGTDYSTVSSSFTDKIQIPRTSHRDLPFLAAQDIDGNGLGDLVVGCGDTASVYIFLDSTLGAGTLVHTDADATVAGATSTAFGGSVGLLDVTDGDGAPELIVSATESSNGVVYVLPLGF